MKKLSVIIPIYNVEKYLIKCLDSIYYQGIDEKEFEVIAVVDGSPDRCLDIATEYALQHNNLVVINKENGGVSSARNKGLEVAQGEYIIFVDPDDCLFPNSLADILVSINKQEAELIILRSFIGTEKREAYRWIDILNIDVFYSGIDVYKKGYQRGSVCGVVFNKRYLLNNELYFPLDIKNSEDSIFFIQCQILARKVLFSDIKAYGITERPESASRNIDKSRLESWFNALEYIAELKNEERYSSVEKSMIDGLKYSMISAITNKSIELMGWAAKEFMQINKVKAYLPIGKENIKHSSLINKLMKLIMNVSYDLFFLISYVRALL